MLTSLASLIFGTNDYYDEAIANLFKETPIKGADGDDWILLELRQPSSDKSTDLSEQSIDSGNTSLTANKLENKQNPGSTEDSSSDDCLSSTNDDNNKLITANIYPTTANIDEQKSEDGYQDDPDETDDDTDDTDGDDDDHDDEVDEIIGDNDINAKKRETANKRKKRRSREHGTLDGSWFVTPPPCFSHKKSTKKVSTSPLEDILIEHPSISVYVSHTSSMDSFCPIPSQPLLSPSATIPSNSSGSPLSLLTTLSASNSPSSSPSSSSQHSPCPSTSTPPHSKPMTGLAITSQIIMASALVQASNMMSPANSSSAATNRSNRSNRGHRNGSSSNNNNNRRTDERNQPQPPRGDEARGAPIENHERNNNMLSDITNHHLAPMQKAINKGSQKKLTKSAIKRQNLVNYQSNRRPTRRHRCTQRPSGFSNNRKMC